MSAKLVWTDAQDAQIRRRRREGATWETIAADLTLPLCTVMERGRRIGVSRPEGELVAEPQDLNRDPLPAGHPASWGTINAGTVLQGAPYPLRFFRR